MTIPGTLTAKSLVQNAKIDPSQHLGVISAASNLADDKELTRHKGKNAFLKTIKYDAVAAAVRQCDSNTENSSTKLSAMSARASAGSDRCSRSTRKKKLTPPELANLKKKSRCRSCSKFCH